MTNYEDVVKYGVPQNHRLRVCYIKYYEIIVHEILGRGWLDSLASPIFDFDAPYLRPTKVSVPRQPTPDPLPRLQTHTQTHLVPVSKKQHATASCRDRTDSNR